MLRGFAELVATSKLSKEMFFWRESLRDRYALCIHAGENTTTSLSVHLVLISVVASRFFPQVTGHHILTTTPFVKFGIKIINSIFRGNRSIFQACVQSASVYSVYM